MRSIRPLLRSALLASALVASAPLFAGDPPAPMPPAAADAAELRSQLEQVRALNAQLHSEREQLEKQLAEVQAQIAAEDRRLKQSAAAPPEANGAPSWALYLLPLAALVLAGAGFYFWRKRRGAQ